ncbi:protein D3-like [Lytechinus pictus]|uniref:protein D3-like n=1 Tax=Lytechinus pictus TaxID=7653 RepID=UPI0030B9F63B
MASPKWAELGVVPDVIDVAPPLRAEVVYPSGVSCDFGNELTPTQVKDMPHITFPSEEGALYTVIMTDWDASEMVREVHHFMMVDVSNGDSKNGTVHSEYIGSGAPEGTGLHRYCFLIYKQPPGFKPAEPYRARNRERRYKFCLKRYAAENDLGDPVAGNFFQAQYDDWVPKQKAELEAATTTQNLQFYSQ